jgi:hypothetical protein
MMRNAETILDIIRTLSVRITGKLLDTETVTSGLGRGCWKSARKGNSGVFRELCQFW